MRAFLVGVVAACAIAALAAFVLLDFVQTPASVSFSTDATRISGG